MIYSLCIYGRTYGESTNPFLCSLEEINSKLSLSLFNLCNYASKHKISFGAKKDIIKKEASQW